MRKRMIEFLVLLMVAIGAGPVGAAFWQWSTTAGSNATADPSINWAEGMAPSSVNDSARAMMAVLANWRNDTSGRLATTGGTTAYVLATSQAFASAADASGAEVSFTINATNAANPTLAVDSVGAAALVVDTVSGPTAVPAGALTQGSVYSAVYYQSGNTWRLKNFYVSTFNVPLGSILWSTLTTAPNANFIAPSGQCISTTTYATYWVALGSPASGACPGGQFAVIDMRGRVAAALDTLNASAANRLTNASTGCGVAFTSVGAVCTENQSATLLLTNLPPITPVGTITNGAITAMTNNVSSAAGGGTLNITVGGFSGAGTFNFASSGFSMTQSASTFTGTTGGGSSTAFSKVQPTIGLIPYLRVL